MHLLLINSKYKDISKDNRLKSQMYKQLPIFFYLSMTNVDILYFFNKFMTLSLMSLEYRKYVDNFNLFLYICCNVCSRFLLCTKIFIMYKGLSYFDNQKICQNLITSFQ